MDGQNYVIFHDAADSSYVNTTANFRGAYAATQTVDIYFKAAAGGDGWGSSAGYDAIAMACTDGEEDRAIEQLAAVMSGSGPKGRITVVADDVNSVYACQDISAVNSISLSATGTFKTFETMTANTNLAKSDSGKTIMLNAAAGLSAIKLPTVSAAGAGWHIDFIVGTVTTSNNYVITEDTATDTNVIISMAVELADTTGPIDAGHTTITFQSTPTKGDRLNIVCDGTNFYAMAVTQDDAGVAFA